MPRDDTPSHPSRRSAESSPLAATGANPSQPASHGPATGDSGVPDQSVQASAAQSPSATDSHARESPHFLSRRRRAQKLLIATVLTGVLVMIVIWSRGVFRETYPDDVLSIAPQVLFEQVCIGVEQESGDKLHITEYAVDDSMIGAMAGCESVETVIFDKGVVTDKSIETIASLPKLEHLRLRLSPIGDEGLKQLAGVESLWLLNLPHAECTAQGIAELAALPRLRQLRLGSKRLGNEVAREIANIKSLRGVHLIGIPITDEGLKTLASMKQLESLYLDDCAVTEAGWDWLFREYPHLHVHVDQIHHDRDPKAHPHH